MNDMANDTAGVVVRPPLLFASGLLAGWLIELAWPLGLLPAGAARWTIGAALVAAAFGLFAWSAAAFRSKGTNIPTNLPTTALVTDGPYRFIRNPIYLALSLLYLGLAVLLGLAWACVLLVPILIVLHWGVVRREEAYLERKFGDAYRTYRARTRRYL